MSASPAADVPPHSSVVTIGNFDGVHRGHQALIAEVVTRARQASAVAVAVIFDPHPLRVLRPSAAPAMLSTIASRKRLLRAQGIDRVLILNFDHKMSRWAPATFVARVLREQLNAEEVHVGAEFRFGRQAMGDVEELNRLGAAHGFVVRPFPLVPGHSSTAVRQMVAHGDVRRAGLLLGRPYQLPVKVGKGTKHIVTATVDADLAVPAPGWYRTTLSAGSGTGLAVPAKVGRPGTTSTIKLVVDSRQLSRTSSVAGTERLTLDFVEADALGRAGSTL